MMRCAPGRPRPGSRTEPLVHEEDGVNGMAGVASLGMAVGRGLQADAVARTLTVVQLGRDLLHEIEAGTAGPVNPARLFRVLDAARDRADDLGVLAAA